MAKRNRNRPGNNQPSAPPAATASPTAPPATAEPVMAEPVMPSATAGLLTADAVAAAETASDIVAAAPSANHPEPETPAEEESDAQPSPPGEPADPVADDLKLVMVECPLALVEGYATRTIEDLPRRTAQTLKSFAAGLAAAGMKLESGRTVGSTRDALVYLAEQLEAGTSGQHAQ